MDIHIQQENLYTVTIDGTAYPGFTLARSENGTNEYRSPKHGIVIIDAPQTVQVNYAIRGADFNDNQSYTGRARVEVSK